MQKSKPRPTFRRRLMTAATLLSVGVLALTEAGVFLGTQQALRAGTDNALLGIARTEIAASARTAPASARTAPASAQTAPAAARTAPAAARTALSLPSGSGYEKFAQIENAQDRIVAQTPNLMSGPPLGQMPAPERRARAGQIVFADVPLGDGSLRCVYYPFQDNAGHSLLAIVGVSRQPIRRTLDALAWLLGLSLLVGAGAAATGASRLAERLTLPLREIALAAHAVEGSRLGTRIPAFSPDAEISDVTAVLNEMLARLEAAFAAQRALTESQSRFVADASHELRTPLSNLRGTVEVALRRPRTAEEYRETLGVSLTEIERLSRIVADLLILSRADAGQFRLSLSACGLSQIAAEAVAACAARAENAGVRLHLDADAALTVLGDADRLREVADNLLDNALRHAPAGSQITVTTRQDGASACLTVQDAGKGLAKEEQTRIFDRFYRADPSRARQSGGMGLGLAIAKAIAEAHSGRITVQSGQGGGAAFTLSVPAASEADQPSHLPLMV